MIGAASRYRELLTQLLIQRELAGGSLPEDVESELVEELDRCWWALGPAEQEKIEQELAAEVAPPTEPDLKMADTQLSPGSHEPPRKVA